MKRRTDDPAVQALRQAAMAFVANMGKETTDPHDRAGQRLDLQLQSAAYKFAVPDELVLALDDLDIENSQDEPLDLIRATNHLCTLWEKFRPHFTSKKAPW